MQNSVDAIGDIKEIKNISGRRSIREAYYEELSSRKKVMNNNEDRSISEPPQSSRYTNNHHHSVGTNSNRLKTIREKIDDGHQCSSDEEDFSKSNSQLNESDLDLEIPESASQTPTPTPLNTGNARRINSETNLNDSKRRLTGFLGNRSKRFCASTSELSFSSHLDTHKSLFSPKNNQNSRSESLYGSNMSLNSTNSRLFMINSPFYGGKTTFGGASAYPRRDINQFKVLRNPVQMRPSSSLSNSSNTSTKSDSGLLPESNAAKRILEIMTQFNGPLKETRSMGSNINSMIKLPGLVQNRKRFGEEDLQLDRSISLSRPTAPYSRPFNNSNASKSNTPESPLLLNSTNAPNSPQVPTMSQLLKMKRLQNNTERAREIANRSENFLNKVHEYKLPPSNDDADVISSNTTSSSSSLKMKNNITKNLLRNDKSANDQLPPAPVNLPNIQLPELKSIPKFDIKLPSATSSAAVSSVMSKSITSSFNVTTTKTTTISPSSSSFNSISSTTTTVKNKLNEQQQQSSFKPINNNFKFSMPIMLNSVKEIDTWNLKASTDSFIFSKPIKINENNGNNDNKEEISSKKSSSTSDSLFKNIASKQKSQSWECESCLVRNDSEKTKCLSCDTLRKDSGISSLQSSTSSNEKSLNVTATPASDDLFKKLAAQQKQSQWECDACMTRNESSKDKCLACETPKPGSNSSKSATATATIASSGFKFGMPSTTTTIDSSSAVVKPVASDDMFKKLAAQQKQSQWECDTCMTRNESSKDKCVACETPKPGSSSNKSTSSAAPVTSSFSFGMKSASNESSSVTPKFSFGMPTTTAATTTENSSLSSTTDSVFKKIVEKQSASWECSACMSRNDPAQTKCICCEQAKPGSSENQSQFSFGSKVTSSVSLPAPSEVKFSFGVQPIKSDSSVSESKKKEDDKKDEVDKPEFSFGIKSSTVETKPASSEAFTAPTFTFKAPTSTSASITIQSPKADEKKIVEEKKSDIVDKGSDKPVMFSFGNNQQQAQAKTAEKKVAFGDEQVKPVAVAPSGGFSFPTSTSASSPVTFGSISTNANGGFAFGNFSKPEEKKSEAVKESPKPIGGFQFSSNANLSAAAATTTSSTTPVQSTNLFSFGTPKTDSNNEVKSTFGSFGSIAAAALPSTNPVIFGSASSTATPSFGSPSTFTFSGAAAAAKKDENSGASPVFSFGAKAPPMIFGSSMNSSSSSTPSVTPVFGSNITSTFGSNNNNSEVFGSKMSNSSFGSIQPVVTPSNQPQKRAFDFGSVANTPSSDVPQNKKFDFGSQQQSQQSPANSAPFQFNAQPDARPAFSFSAASAPTFNFTANNNVPATNNSQENIFQFGANISSAQGIYAFEANPQQQQQPVTPVMQFGATSTPTVAIAGINAFSSQQTTGANAQNRKILRAARRTVRR